jgi:small multidrug resistance family-3 protein
LYTELFTLYLAETGVSVWMLVPAVLIMAVAAGLIYAADGGAYIFVAILWLWMIEGIRPPTWDVAGAIVALQAMMMIIFAPEPRAERLI